MGVIQFNTIVQVCIIQDGLQVGVFGTSSGVECRCITLYRAAGTPIGSAFIGVEYDGQNIVSIHNVGANDIVTRMQLNPGGNITRMETATPLNNNLIDFCFDGHYWVGLFSGNFRAFSDWKFSQNFGPTNNHGLSSPSGIFFDGTNYGIIAT